MKNAGRYIKALLRDKTFIYCYPLIVIVIPTWALKSTLLAVLWFIWFIVVILNIDEE